MFLKKVKSIFSLGKYIYRDNKKSIPIIKKDFLPKEREIINLLFKNGFAVIKDFLSSKDCDYIIKKIDSTIKDHPNKIWQDQQGSDKRIFGAELIDQKIMDFFKDGLMHSIGEAYCGCKLKNIMTMANRVKYLENNLGSGGGWHKDAYRRQFKSLLYLQKVDSSNGPFQLIKNSNKIFNTLINLIKLNEGYPNTRFENEEIIKNFNEDEIVTLEGEVGTLILFDPALIHRGAPILKSARYAITNYYESVQNADNALGHFTPKFK